MCHSCFLAILSSATILDFTLTGFYRLGDFTWLHFEFTHFIPNNLFYQDNTGLYEIFSLKKRRYDNNKILYYTIYYTIYTIYELLEVF